MTAAAFQYERPSCLGDALEALAEPEIETRLLAGGQSLVPALVARSTRPQRLVDIDRLAELEFVREEDAGVAIGALCRHDALARADLDPAWRGLQRAASCVGLHPIRKRGTLGGSLAHADPAAELPAAVLGYDGEVVVASSRARRRIPAAEFFRGPHLTSLEDEEAIVEVWLPTPAPGTRSGFVEVAHRAVGWPIAGVCVSVAHRDGVVAEVRIATAAVEDVPRRLHAAEQELHGTVMDDVAIDRVVRLAAEQSAPRNSDGVDPAYRRRLVAALTRDLLTEMLP